MILFELIGDQFGPLGWSLYHFLWQGMLVAALYGVACLLCGDNARRRNALASLFLVVAIGLPAWQIWMILVRHHGLALGIGPPESLLPWISLAALLWLFVAAALSASTLIRAGTLKQQMARGCGRRPAMARNRSVGRCSTRSELGCPRGSIRNGGRRCHCGLEKSHHCDS